MSASLGIAEFFTGAFGSYARNRREQHEKELAEEQRRVEYVGKLMADPTLTPSARQQVQTDFMKMIGGKGGKESKKGWDDIFKLVQEGSAPEGVPLKQTSQPGQAGQQPLPEGRTGGILNEQGQPMPGTAPTPSTAKPAIDTTSKQDVLKSLEAGAGSKLERQPMYLTPQQQAQESAQFDAEKAKALLPIQKQAEEYKSTLRQQEYQLRHQGDMEKLHQQAEYREQQIDQQGDLRASLKLRELRSLYPDASSDDILNIARQKSQIEQMKGMATVDKLRNDIAMSHARLDMMQKGLGLRAASIEAADRRAAAHEAGATTRAGLGSQARELTNRISQNQKLLNKLSESVDAAHQTYNNKNFFSRWMSGAPDVSALQEQMHELQTKIGDDGEALKELYGTGGDANEGGGKPGPSAPKKKKDDPLGIR